MRVEAAKIALSDGDATRLPMSDLSGGPNPVLRRAAFEAAVEDPMARIAGLLAGVMAQAGITAAQVGAVFLTGGSSQLPLLRATVQAAVPGARLVTGDMLGSVGTGWRLRRGGASARACTPPGFGSALARRSRPDAHPQPLCRIFCPKSPLGGAISTSIRN